MKRIVNVSYFSTLKLKNCYINDINRKVTNGFIRNGYEVINYCDRDVCRYFGFGGNNFFGLKKLQRHFIQFCLDCQPDAILLSHANTINPKTLQKIKQLLPNVKIMQYNLDAINSKTKASEENVKSLKSYIDIVDATLVSTGEKELLKQFKTNTNYVGFMPNIVDKSIETGKVFEQEVPEYIVSFGGNEGVRDFCGKEVMYTKIVDKIKKLMPASKLNVFGLNKQNKIEGPKYQNVFANTAIGLNLSRFSSDYLYSSDRISHIMGNGCLCMLQESTGFKDIFNDDEVAFYKTEEEFYDKLEYFAKNSKKRMKVAKKGYNKYVKYFNEKVVTKYMADILFSELNKEDYIWTKLVDLD
jgi:hypothetical protein